MRSRRTMSRKSLSRLRSCTSSTTTCDTPPRSVSPSRRRKRMPMVQNRMRVFRPATPKRTQNARKTKTKTKQTRANNGRVRRLLVYLQDCKTMSPVHARGLVTRPLCGAAIAIAQKTNNPAPAGPTTPPRTHTHAHTRVHTGFRKWWPGRATRFACSPCGSGSPRTAPPPQRAPVRRAWPPQWR